MKHFTLRRCTQAAAILTSIALSNAALAQTVDWLTTYHSPGSSYNEGHFIKRDPAGNLFVVGQASHNNGAFDGLVQKYDSSGALQWSSWLDTAYVRPSGFGLDSQQNVVMSSILQSLTTGEFWPGVWSLTESGANRFAFAEVNGYNNGIAVEPDGTFVTVGTDYSPEVARVRKYSSSGTLTWTRTYTLAAFDVVNGLGIAEDDLKNIYVLANARRSSDHRWELKTIKYSPAGVKLWVHTLGGASVSNEAGQIVARPGGGCVVTATTWDGLNYGTENCVTLSINDAGQTVWKRQYDSVDHLKDSPMAIAMSANGNVAVTGVSLAAPGYTVITILYDSAGTKLWAYRYRPESSAVPRSIAIAPNGSVYVAGEIYRSGSKHSSMVLKLSAAGAFVWRHKYLKVAGGFAESKAVTTDENSNAIVTGWTYDPITNSGDLVLFKIH